ncbi:hypothetical protein [Schinkia azotoformans]|uniref:hypothetical protein n=1 Tax=Schinkia azotoformans TaxID=1454 RepID=UPI002DB6543F|nr:hypothetical protein [Schinkia azotoformans]MEC1759854.1 hypothetical protein [Schinkia azotoformans]
MKQKGSPKRVENLNFWGNHESKVSDELKTMIYEQYFSNDLHIYCDCSFDSDLSQMAVGCTYVRSCRIIVKQQYVYPPIDCTTGPMYGEIKAILFGLTHFEKYIMPDCKKVVLYSDVDDIEGLLENKITFKRNASLKKLQSELINLYQKTKKLNPNKDIEIKYLARDVKIYNPFHRSAHNAANRMLNKTQRK